MPAGGQSHLAETNHRHHSGDNNTNSNNSISRQAPTAYTGRDSCTAYSMQRFF